VSGEFFIWNREKGSIVDTFQIKKGEIDENSIIDL
jgi:hypothetical protein